jgi:DNA-binding CsgD family transcriptional regulator
MNKDKVISFFLLLIIIFKVFDLYIDFANNVKTHHIIQEVMLVLLSLGLFIYLAFDIRLRSQQALLLANNLKNEKQRSENLSKQVLDTKKAFFNAMYEQFDTWQLTPTEKEVALLLVKGLTNNEIAVVREKSEKTISHQSSAVYKKAGVKGRHELVALFFDDLII